MIPNSSWPKFCARPARAVITLHAMSPTEMIVRRDDRSARRAMGRPASRCTVVNAGPINQPRSRSVRESDFAMSSASTAMIVRSHTLNTATRKIRPRA